MDINFDNDIKKILIRIHPHLKIENSTLKNLNVYLKRIIEKLSNVFAIMIAQKKAKTLLPTDIQNTLLSLFFGNIKINSIIQGRNAIVRFEQSFQSQKIKKKISVCQRANINIPPSKIHKILKEELNNHLFEPRVSEKSSIYFAAVIEYLLAEILELAGNQTMNKGNNSISIDDYKIAIENDYELRKSLCHL